MQFVQKGLFNKKKERKWKAEESGGSGYHN